MDVQEVFAEALEVSGAIDDFIDCLDENRDSFATYDNYWQSANDLLYEWGTEDNLELIGALCSVPRDDAKEELKALSENHAIPSIIAEDEEMKEELFLAIQRYTKNYYIDADASTRPNKEIMSKIAKMLAYALEAFGYGICPNGILMIMRTFNHGVAEGVGTDWYEDDSIYDAEYFGYYDSIENEEIFDKFYSENSIESLLA